MFEFIFIHFDEYILQISQQNMIRIVADKNLITTDQAIEKRGIINVRKWAWPHRSNSIYKVTRCEMYAYF